MLTVKLYLSYKVEGKESAFLPIWNVKNRRDI